MEKIGEVKKPCLSEEHDPPKYQVLEPGIYRHICPKCKKEMIIKKELIY
jgi:hypothetical protein